MWGDQSNRLPGEMEVEVECWVTHGTFDHYQGFASCVHHWAFYKPNRAFLCHFMVTTLGFAHRCQRVPRAVRVVSVDEKFKCNPSSSCWDISVPSRNNQTTDTAVPPRLEIHLCVHNMLKREGIFFFFWNHLVQELLSPIIAATSRAVVPIYVMCHTGRVLSAQSSDKFRLGALKKCEVHDSEHTCCRWTAVTCGQEDVLWKTERVCEIAACSCVLMDGPGV